MTQYVFAVANGPSSPDTASIMDSSTKRRPSLTRPRRTNAVPLPANAPATRSASRVSRPIRSTSSYNVTAVVAVAVEVESPYRLQLDQSSQLRAGFAALEQPLGASAQPKATATRLRMPWAMTRSTAKPAARRSWAPAMQSANARWRNSMLASHSPTHTAAVAPRSRSSRSSEASESGELVRLEGGRPIAPVERRCEHQPGDHRRSQETDPRVHPHAQRTNKQGRTRASPDRRGHGGEDEWSGLKTW